MDTLYNVRCPVPVKSDTERRRVATTLGQGSVPSLHFQRCFGDLAASSESAGGRYECHEQRSRRKIGADLRGAGNQHAKVC